MSNAFSRILVGIDDSEPAKAAAALGARLAREHDGELVLCSAVNWLPVIAELESTGAIIDPKPTIDGLAQHGEALLDTAVARALRSGVAAQHYLVEGDPAAALMEIAGRLQCGLIVMGTHGRRGLNRLFVGSTTDAVLRGSAIPVLTVRPGTIVSDEARGCFERIVVAVDGSEPADAALEAVLALPAAHGRHVLFCSVVDLDSVIGARGYFDAAIRDSLQEDARNVIERALAEARARNVNAEGRIAEGAASRTLIAVAKQHRADLIVTGSHGRRGMRRVFLGSVAESIVRTAPVPVLVVRTPSRIPVESGVLKRQPSAV